MTAKTDRELLELAAKAAGYAIHDFYIDVEAWAYQEGSEPDHDGELPIFLWKPLTDDGDALRLAVKLGIDVEQSNGFAIGRRPFDGNDTPRGRSNRATCIDYGSDPYTATRRAITRAAAVIGETL